jgi:hypothetical protein
MGALLLSLQSGRSSPAEPRRGSAEREKSDGRIAARDDGIAKDLSLRYQRWWPRWLPLYFGTGPRRVCSRHVGSVLTPSPWPRISFSFSVSCHTSLRRPRQKTKEKNTRTHARTRRRMPQEL